MLISGTLSFFYGLIAAFNDERVVFGNRADLYLDLTAWGWVHMVLGAIVAVLGIYLFTGNLLARAVGVAVAAANIVTNFLWMPAYPVWSVIVIALDVLIIWALTAHGREAQV